MTRDTGVLLLHRIPEARDDGPCGLVVPPRDFAALGAAIERLLHEAALRQTLARLGPKRVENTFDLWRNGARLAEQLCATRHRAPGEQLFVAARACTPGRQVASPC